MKAKSKNLVLNLNKSTLIELQKKSIIGGMRKLTGSQCDCETGTTCGGASGYVC